MDIEQELIRLRGQELATRMVVVGLCLELRKYNEEGDALVARAFNYADRAIEAASLMPSKAAPKECLDAALVALEQLGNAALTRATAAVSW